MEIFSIILFSSVTQSCLTLCDPINHSMPGLPVHHQFQNLPKLMYTELVMPSNNLIFCCPLLLLPSIFPSIRVMIINKELTFLALQRQHALLFAKPARSWREQNSLRSARLLVLVSGHLFGTKDFGGGVVVPGSICRYPQWVRHSVVKHLGWSQNPESTQEGAGRVWAGGGAGWSPLSPGCKVRRTLLGGCECSPGHLTGTLASSVLWEWINSWG